MNTYKTSTGERVSQATINKNIRLAKMKFYNTLRQEGKSAHCNALGENVYGEPVDCSHIISVADCKNYGMVELAWDINNFQPESRTQHLLWENGPQEKRERQFNYFEKVRYVREHNEEIYQKRYVK